MKKIVVPIDFSQTSDNATDYAIDLALALDLSIHLLHVYTPMGVSLDDAAYVSHAELRSEFEEKLEERLRYVLEKVGDKKIEAKAELEYGFPARKISEYSEMEDTSFIVIGSTGASGAFERIFGKVSTDVALHAHCPVLLIPDGFSFRGINRILYATKYMDLDSKLMPYVGMLAKALNASISLVHHADDSTEEYSITAVKNQLLDSIEGIQVDTETDHSGSFSEILEYYSTERDFDLIIMASKKRDYFQRLFHPSMVRKMAFSSKIPLCVLHEGGHRVINN